MATPNAPAQTPSQHRAACSRRGVDLLPEFTEPRARCETVAVVVFEIAGGEWPLDNHFAEMLATAFRVSVATEAETRNVAGSAFLADAIESALVGATSEPIPIGEDAAEALFYQLNVSLKNPEPIDPAYDLYLEVRRYLGRLYS